MGKKRLDKCPQQLVLWGDTGSLWSPKFKPLNWSKCCRRITGVSQPYEQIRTSKPVIPLCWFYDWRLILTGLKAFSSCLPHVCRSSSFLMCSISTCCSFGTSPSCHLTAFLSLLLSVCWYDFHCQLSWTACQSACLPSVLVSWESFHNCLLARRCKLHLVRVSVCGGCRGPPKC